jgi:hypothetical protein
MNKPFLNGLLHCHRFDTNIMFLDITHRSRFYLKHLLVHISRHNVGNYILSPCSGDRIQSPKRCVWRYEQDGVLGKNRNDS